MNMQGVLEVSDMCDGDFLYRQKTQFFKCLFKGTIPGQFLNHSRV